MRVYRFLALQKSLNEQIAGSEQRINSLAKSKATAEQLKAESDAERSSKRETVRIDTKTLSDLKDTQFERENEFAARSTDRKMEVTAIEQAQGFLGRTSQANP